MNKLGSLVILVLTLALWAPSAVASQDAVIIVEQAAIREMPSIDAKILESKPVRSVIRVSSFSKDGWYKIKASNGQFGWIWQGDLSLTTYDSDVRAGNLDLSEREHDRRDPIKIPWLYVRLGATAVPLFSQVGETSPTLNLGVGGYLQVAFKLADDLRLAARVMAVSSAFQLSDFSNPTDLTASTTMAMVGLEQIISNSDNVLWWLGFFSGIDLTSTVSGNTGVTNTQGIAASTGVSLNSDASIMTVTQTGYPFMFTFGYSYRFSRILSIQGEGGVLFNYIPAVDMPNFGSQHINEFGPIFSFAVQLNN